MRTLRPCGRMKSQEVTTVVIITHNYGHFLRGAIESVLNQTRRPRMVVIDDASEDSTPEIMQGVLRDFKGELIYRRFESCQGLSRVRNFAAERVDTERLIYLDADDWLKNDFIEKGEDWLEAHPEVDALTTDMCVVFPSGNRRTLRSQIPSSWKKLLRRNTIFQTSLIRRQMILELGAYDPNLHYEDWDFWIRAMKAGYKIGRLPGAYVFRREHGSNKSRTCPIAEAELEIRERHRNK